ncbi:MAG: SDR family NAD(P)-dependent oxidoreductase [Fibrobacterales bacterium]
MNILITGVSSGIGHGLAKQYLDMGHQVFGLSRREPKGLSKLDTFTFVSCDLSDHFQIASAIESLIGECCTFDLVLLNAGMLGSVTSLQGTSILELEESMTVNVWANKIILDTLYDLNVTLTQVVATSSGAAVSGNKGWSGYAISKAALNMLIALYAAERPETHFCAFAPGLVDTAMQDYLCDQVNGEEYPTVARIQAARGTDAMPTPELFAQRAVAVIPKLTQFESGSFQDIRKIDL